MIHARPAGPVSPIGALENGPVAERDAGVRPKASPSAVVCEASWWVARWARSCEVIGTARLPAWQPAARYTAAQRNQLGRERQGQRTAAAGGPELNHRHAVVHERRKRQAFANDVRHPPKMRLIDALRHDRDMVALINERAAEIHRDALDSTDRRPVLACYDGDAQVSTTR
jgi:hypothetical protein